MQTQNEIEALRKELSETKAKLEASEWVRKDNALRTYDGLTERVKELEAENKRILNLARDFGDLMETINIHGGYQFSQPIIKFKQSLTPPERGEK